MRVLVACEFSGTVREAFKALGHEAVSCDLLPADDGSPSHHQGNVLGGIMDEGWDLMIAHPPCTHLAVSGARWFKEKALEQLQALEFVRKLLDAPIERIALENPISIISSRIRKPDQIIQPWQFGHGEVKLFKAGTTLYYKGFGTSLSELAMKEAPTIGEAIMRTMLDHYWDSLEPQKDLILKHIEGAMRAISPRLEEGK